MSASHAVAHNSSSQAQAVNNTDAAAAQRPENQAAGDVFQQMLLEMLSTNIEDPAALQDLLSGVELPAGGETLPSENLLDQLSENGLDKEQLSGLFELLGITDPEAQVNAEELLATIQQQLQRLDPQASEQKLELTPEQLLQQARAAAAAETQPSPEAVAESEQSKALGADVVSSDDLTELAASRQQAAADQGLSVPEQSKTEAAERFVRNQQANEAEAVATVDVESVDEEKVAAEERKSEDNPPRSEVAERVFNVEPKDRAEAAKQAAVDRDREDRPDVDRAQRNQQQQVVVDAARDSAQPVAAAAAANHPVSESTRQAAATESRTEARIPAQDVQNNAQQSSANTDAADQDGGDADNQSRRSQQFREGLAAMRSEIQAAARELADNAPRSNNNLGNGFVMPGQTASNDTASRTAGMLSGFQQLQQLYSGQSPSQVTLAAGARFGEQNWSSSMAQRITWMANQQVGRADIQLDPPDLGSLHIRLHIQNDQTSVSFTSPHAQVRDALEQQMPRLREMLEEAGLQLEQSDVSDQSASQGSDEYAEGSSGRRDVSADADEELLAGAVGRENANLSLVDYYA